jgi:ferredoxin
MKIRVNPEKCMGHGMCTALVPDVYQINEESGYNEMGDFERPDDDRAEVLRGVSACPEGAISVLDEANA